MASVTTFLGLLPFFPLFLALIGLVYWRWIRPRPSLEWQARGLLLLLALALAGGGLGAFFWWLGIPGSFAWSLPPLAGRMLAAAGWAFAGLCAMALDWPSRRRLRLALWMLVVYLVPIAAAILLAHRDRLDWNAPISYAFLWVVAVLIGAAAYYLARQPAIPAVADDPQPTSDITRKWLALVGGIAFAWGAALFLADSGSSPLIWAWPGDLLTSRLIAVMLLALSFGCAYTLRRAGPARVMLVVALIYGVGLASAGLWSLTPGKPVPWGYVGVFGVIGLGSAITLLVGLRNRVQ